jgi:hypothetical protein
MREAVPTSCLGNGDGNDRLRRQNRGRCVGTAPQKNQVHLRNMQLDKEQNPMRVSLQTKSHQLRLEAPLKASSLTDYLYFLYIRGL